MSDVKHRDGKTNIWVGEYTKEKKIMHAIVTFEAALRARGLRQGDTVCGRYQSLLPSCRLHLYWRLRCLVGCF